MGLLSLNRGNQAWHVSGKGIKGARNPLLDRKIFTFTFYIHLENRLKKNRKTRSNESPKPKATAYSLRKPIKKIETTNQEARVLPENKGIKGVKGERR